MLGLLSVVCFIFLALCSVCNPSSCDIIILFICLRKSDCGRPVRVVNLCVCVFKNRGKAKERVGCVFEY